MLEMTAIDRNVISTHAPRAGSDRNCWNGQVYRSDFNPRSPCGERHQLDEVLESLDRFQPTLPVRGATPSL